MALEDIDPDIVGMLLPGEQVIFIASQSKVAPRLALSKQHQHHEHARPFQRLALGLRTNILDISYKDISTVMLKRGVFSTELYFKPHSTTYKIKLPALEKRAAQSQPAHPERDKGRVAKPEPPGGDRSAGGSIGYSPATHRSRKSGSLPCQRGFVPLLQP